MEAIKPKATVIIPAFNTQKTLAPWPHAILNQKEKEIEIIVVDDCSTDDTVKIASQFPVSVIKNSENSGAGFSRNSEPERRNLTTFSLWIVMWSFLPMVLS
jgi:glycosyltransferase involved in cell wall biosynthesis